MKTDVYRFALALVSSLMLHQETIALSIRPALLGARRAASRRDAALVDSDSEAASLAFYRGAPVEELSTYKAYTAADSFQISASALTSSAQTKAPLSLDPLEIPRRREGDIAVAKVIMQMELVLGRSAMIAAVLLFLGEFTTGQSLPEQIASVLR